MWVFVGDTRTLLDEGSQEQRPAPCEPLVGIGEGPFEDEEFAQLVARYEAHFEDGQGSVEASGLYERRATPKNEPAPESAPPAEQEA